MRRVRGVFAIAWMAEPDLRVVRAPFPEQLGEVWDKSWMREEPAEYVAVRALPAKHAAHVKTWGRAISGEGSAILGIPQLRVSSTLELALVGVDGSVCCLYFFRTQNIPNVDESIEIKEIFLCARYTL